MSCAKTLQMPISFFSGIDAQYVIVAVVAFAQGMQHLADLSIQYMFKDDFHIGPARMGMYMSYVTIPWYYLMIIYQFYQIRVIKPIWGLLTDAKPLFGYRRKSYLILFGFLGTVGWILLAYYGLNDLYIALGLLLLIQFCTCFCNVVGEAILVEIAGRKDDNRNRGGSRNGSAGHSAVHNEQSQEQQNKDFQNRASASVSLFFGVRAAGALVSAYFSGALLIYITKKEVFLITAIFPFTLMFIAFFLNEKRIDSSNPNEQRVINISECIIDFWTFFQNPLIYKPVLLIFCFMMAPSSGAIMFYFYTEVLNFSPQFLGELKFMYAAGTILGVLMYNTCLKNVSLKLIFAVTSFFYFLCYESLIILVTRKNVEWGIDDRLFCIGDSIMLQLVGELNMMPLLVLACKMCPKNIEATMYAMLMSTMNLGSMLGAQWGALFLIILGIDENDFSRLWLFIAITGIFILLPLPWLYVIKEDEIMAQREQRIRVEQLDRLEGGDEINQNDIKENVFEQDESTTLLNSQQKKNQQKID